jgi:cysteine-rich repeat protein
VACADGYHNLTANEDCDDGNKDVGDACSPLCKAAVIEIDDDAAPLDTFLFISVWPDVAALPMGGGFRVAWIDLNGHDGSGNAQIAKLDLDGSMSGLVGLATAPPVDEIGPEIMRMATNGVDQSVVAWRSAHDNSLRIRRVNAAGNPQGAMDEIVPGSMGAQAGIPGVAAGPDNGFCITWDRNSDTTLMTSVINPQGELAAISTPVVALDITLGDSAIFASDGGYMLSYIEPSVARDVMGLKLAITGVAVGDPFLITQLDTVSFVGGGFGRPNGPEFVSLFGIRALHGEATEATRSMFRRFSEPDMPIDDEALVSTVHKEELFNHVAVGPGGKFTVAWTEQDEATDACTIVARYFEADGTPQGLPFDVTPPDKTACNALARTAVSPAGDVIYTWLAWSTESKPTYGVKVFAKIFPRRLAAD